MVRGRLSGVRGVINKCTWLGHQDIAVNCAAIISRRLDEPVAIARIVLIGKEGRRAIVAALDQVQRRRSGRADAAPCNGWLDRPVDARGDERAGNCRSPDACRRIPLTPCSTMCAALSPGAATTSWSRRQAGAGFAKPSTGDTCVSLSRIPRRATAS